MSDHEASHEQYQLAREGSHFTIRAVLAGLFIGSIIAVANFHFGLQTGWGSGMTLPSILLGFSIFKVLAPLLKTPFSPVENVLVQTVAQAVGTIPIGGGFVGPLIALQFLLKDPEKPEGHQGYEISTTKLIVWSLGTCFFGVFFAVPLRKQTIIREKLPFPTGTAGAELIKVLHPDEKDEEHAHSQRDTTADEEAERLLPHDQRVSSSSQGDNSNAHGRADDDSEDWKTQIWLLSVSFGVSAAFTIGTYFLPVLQNIPIFGTNLAANWLITFNLSPAYIGQGIIMGPETTAHMLLGLILGWGVLSPIAKHKGWAPGDVGDWQSGSRGWIVWVSLAVILADSFISLGWLALEPALALAYQHLPRSIKHHRLLSYTSIQDLDSSSTVSEPDAPPEHLIRPWTTTLGLVLSLAFCILCVRFAFPTVPLTLTLLSLVLALLLSIMAVRALGQTDSNPVSGLSKLTQLLIALATPRSASPTSALVTNLVLGGISEAAALQGGDMIQDFKTGHLVGASPRAQTVGQLVGAAFGSVVAAAVYRVYANVYAIPSAQFEVPSAYLWLRTAELVLGDGLPPGAAEVALGCGALFVAFTAVRLYAEGRAWKAYVPGGVAVGLGIFLSPSYTFARALGGLINWYWLSRRGGSKTNVILVAAGGIMAEGLMSLVNLIMASFGVPHL